MTAKTSLSLEVVMAIDTLEIKAHSLARVWGIPPATTAVYPVSPCPRPACGGSVMVLGDGPRRCLLCARADDDTTEASYAAEQATRELMG